jgi:hypothetical protein
MVKVGADGCYRLGVDGISIQFVSENSSRRNECDLNDVVLATSAFFERIPSTEKIKKVNKSVGAEENVMAMRSLFVSRN